MKTLLIICLLVCAAAPPAWATADQAAIIRRLAENEQELRELNEGLLRDLDEERKETAGAVTSKELIGQQAAALKASDDKHTAELNTEREKNEKLQAFWDHMHAAPGWNATKFGLALMAKWILGVLAGVAVLLGVFSFFFPPVAAFLSMFFTNLFTLFKKKG